MKKRKLLDVPTDDIKVLSVYAKENKNMKFKAFAEKVLMDQAKKIRKLSQK